MLAHKIEERYHFGPGLTGTTASVPHEYGRTVGGICPELRAISNRDDCR